MSIRRALPVVTLVVLALVAPACDDDNGSRTMIGVTDPSAAFSNRLESVTPSAASFISVPGAFCPDAPLLGSFNLTIGAGGTDLFLSSVQTTFVDQSGFQSPTTTIMHSTFSDRMGSVIPASTTRTFPLQFPFGCAGVPPGTLSVVVVTSDSQNRDRRTSFNVPVR